MMNQPFAFVLIFPISHIVISIEKVKLAGTKYNKYAINSETEFTNQHFLSIRLLI